VNRCWPEPLAPSGTLLAYLRRRRPDHPWPDPAQPSAGAPDLTTIYVGAGTCGLGAGAVQTKAAILAFLADRRLEARVVEVGCIGLCSEEPLVDFAAPGRPRLCCARVTAEVVPQVLEALFEGEVPRPHAIGQFRDSTGLEWPRVPHLDELPFFRPQTRWVLENCGIIDPGSFEAYVARGGYAALAAALTTRTPAEIRELVLASGLRGRGGGGFPTAQKWKLAAAQGADQKYLICNADEGDPGAFMDRAVIEGDPHRLIEGMALAAYAIGASKAYVYLRAEYPLAISRLEAALVQAQSAGLLGKDILDSGFALDVTVKMGAGAFVCGEETALMRSIEGKRGMPTPRPPFPAASGLFGKPTVVNNVETLANVPRIVALGAEAFRALGTEGSKGTKVFALSGKIARTGLAEVAMGTTLRQIVFDVAGGVPADKAFKAVQIGGPSGGCIPESELDIQIDYESLKTVGAMMGSGGLVVMDEDNCMVDIAKFFMDFIQRESCGKCIPCREGTRRMLEILEMITRGRHGEQGADALERFQGVLYLQRLAEVIRDTSLCGLGQSAPNPVLSTLRWFRHEYEDHVYDRHCPSLVCRGLLTYRIDPELCNGCTRCARECPADAILGAQRSVHHVVDEKCIRCGACVDNCRYDAVIVA